MKLIYKLAKLELKNLVYSPVAWFLGIAFLVQCALYYTTIIERYAKWQELFTKNSSTFTDFQTSLTRVVFLGGDGIFSGSMSNLYLFLPLLTMGMISKEFNNGTIKLLYSAPIKSRHIVFGKFLALMIYNLVLVGIIGMFMVMGMINIRNVDIGILLSAALGFYLLVCAFAAIGLFMSSLTTYQIVSAIATFMVILILSRIGGLWQNIDFVRDLTYFLSISGRAQNFLSGLITSREVIYFLLIIFMFLFFTLFKMKGSREFKPWYSKAARYIGVIVVVLTIGYISSRPGLIGYWDTTRAKTNTIHPRTQEVIKGFDKNEPLEVTLYANMLDKSFDMSGAPEARNHYLWGFWEQYVRFKPDIKFNYVNYYDIPDGDSSAYRMFPGKNIDEIAKLMAEGKKQKLSNFKKPAEIRKMIDLNPEAMRAVMELKYKGKTTYLRTFDDPRFWPDQIHVSAAFKKLQQAEMPQVLFTSGNLERSIYKTGEREFFFTTNGKGIRMALINLGFQCDTINLENQEIPAGITALVVADPKSEMSQIKQEKIRKFVADGGNTVFLGEPGKQQMLNPLLADLGIKLPEGTLVQLSKDEMPHIVKPYFTKAAGFISDDYHLSELREMGETKKPVDTQNLLMAGVAEVEQIEKGQFTMVPLALTREGKVFNKTGKLVTDSVPPVFNELEGDTRKPVYVTLAGFTRKVGNKEQRILVSGDADYFSALRGGGGWNNVAMYSWLDFNRFPVYTPMPKPIDTSVTISDAGSVAQSTFFVWILPAAVLVLGAVILIRRKRK